jgi:dinuclear metal center YbgI/SA1388 family protein
MPRLAEIAGFCDELLSVSRFPDSRNALNGIQVDTDAEITRIAAAVDGRRRTILAAQGADANLLIVHHGIFWGGLQPLAGARFNRVAPLLGNGIGVYSSHIPLDAHPEIGNNSLLARALELHASGPFGIYEDVAIGVMGEDMLPTAALIQRVSTFASRYDGTVRTSPVEPGHVTRRWAIMSGAGANSGSIAEAVKRGVDTLITGEGAHHTAIEAEEAGIVIVYAGHYATETLGVQALAERVREEFGIPWEFVHEPTGL